MSKENTINNFLSKFKLLEILLILIILPISTYGEGKNKKNKEENIKMKQINNINKVNRLNKINKLNSKLGVKKNQKIKNPFKNIFEMGCKNKQDNCSKYRMNINIIQSY